MSPEVTWESEVAGWMTVGTSESCDGVLGETTLKGSNVIVGGWNALAEDGKEEDDWRACEAKERPSKRYNSTAKSFQRTRSRMRFCWERRIF